MEAKNPTPSAKEVLATLRKIYHPPKTFLKFETPFQLLVATILSAQCTDRQVNSVTPPLFKKFPDAQAFAVAPRRTIEAAIHSCGTFHAKAKYIQTLSRILVKNFRGQVPQTMEELVALPGVGRKTAAIVLYAAFGKNEGIAVDTHVFRLARRLGLTKAKNPEKVEKDLQRVVQQKDWGKINLLLISHGRAVCTARSRKCDQCVFCRDCPSSSTEGREDLAVP